MPGSQFRFKAVFGWFADGLRLSRFVRKRNHVKRLSPDRNDLSFPPDRVRLDEIEKSAFFGGLLLFEQPVHVSREFEQPDGLHPCIGRLRRFAENGTFC